MPPTESYMLPGLATRPCHMSVLYDEGKRDDGIYIVMEIQSKPRRNKRFTQTHAPDKGEIRALKSNRAASREDQA